MVVSVGTNYFTLISNLVFNDGGKSREGSDVIRSMLILGYSYDTLLLTYWLHYHHYGIY